jgi:hypothetical protein
LAPDADDQSAIIVAITPTLHRLPSTGMRTMKATP